MAAWKTVNATKFKNDSQDSGCILNSLSQVPTPSRFFRATLKSPSAMQPTDMESVHSDEDSSSEASSIADDAVKPSLTKWDSFHQMFCISLGTSFFLAPAYLKDVGIVPGIVFGAFASLSYLYTSHLYFWCERRLRQCSPSVQSVTTIYELVEQTFVHVVQSPKVGRYLKLYLKYEVVFNWILCLAVTLLFISENFQLILRNNGYKASDVEAILLVFVSLVSLVLISNLTTLRRVFYVASVSVAATMVETLVYIFTVDSHPVEKIKFFGSPNAIPTYINNIQLTVATPPLLFLYKKEMKRERDLTALSGSLNAAVCCATALMIFYALACGIHFGDQVAENIIGNLPNNLLVNLTNLIMTVNLILIEPINFYGLYTYLWEGALRDRFGNSIYTTYYEYAAKIGIYSFVVTLALLLPSIPTLINLIGCVTVINDIVTVPIVLETIMIWKYSSSRRWKLCTLLKNCVILILTVVYCAWSLVNSVSQYEV